MIIDFTLIVIYKIVYFLIYPIRHMNSVSVSPDFISAIEQAKTYLASVDLFIPVNVILIILGIEIGLEIGIFSYKVIMWFIKRLPTQS